LHPDPGSNFWIHNPGKQLPPQHGPAGCSAHPLPGRALSTLNSHPVSLLHSPTMTLSPPLQDPCLLGRTRDRNTTKCHSCLQGESPFLIISVLPVCIFPVRCFHAVCNHRGGCTDGEQRYWCCWRESCTTSSGDLPLLLFSSPGPSLFFPTWNTCGSKLRHIRQPASA